MDAAALRAAQAPLKQAYRDDPAAALRTLTAKGDLCAEGLICAVATDIGVAGAGLHPATGGDGTAVCSGDMLLQALVACAGVTLCAVATAMEVDIRGGSVRAEGDLDFRGTLGVDKTAPVGFTDIRLEFTVDSDAPAQKLETLLNLTERYCVVYQTLVGNPDIRTTLCLH